MSISKSSLSIGRITEIQNLMTAAVKAYKSLDFKLPKKQKLDKISNWYKSEKLVMVLGAGVSASYSLPDWNTLLQKLLLITIKHEENDDKKKFQKVKKPVF